MGFKRTGITGGSANQLGGQDWDHLVDLFEGVADVETLDINSNTGFRSGKLRKRGTGSPFYYIENTSAIVADRTITEPLLTANDQRTYDNHPTTLAGKSISGSTNTITNIGDSAISAHTSTKITITDRTHLPPLAAYLDTVQAFTAAKKFDLPIKVKPTALPTTDASYGQLICNSSDGNKPYFLLPSGTSYNLTSGAGAGGTPYIYDTFPSTYDITTDDTVTGNGLWRVVYRGTHPTEYNVTGTGDGSSTLATGAVTRYGIQVNTASALIGFPLKTWTVRLKKTGTPTGNITATVRNSSDVVQATFTTSVVASTLTTSFADVIFTLASPQTLVLGDRIVIEYAGANGVIIELFTTDHFDGSATRRTSFNVGTGLYTESSSADVLGTMTLQDPGQVGVRAPSGGAFSRVMYQYPYLTTHTGTGTSASLVLTEGPTFTDFDITLSGRTVDQRKSTPNAWETLWIMFRYTDAYHHYYLTLKNNGTLELGRKDNTGSFDEQYFLSTGVAYTYVLNTFNKIRIKAVSNHITVWIDDVQKIDLIDDGAGGAQGGAPNTPAAPTTALYSGKLGLYNEDAEVEFSSPTLTDLSAGSAASSTASYVTLATDSSLASERVLTAGSGISLTDSGAGNSIIVTAKNRTLNKIASELNIVSSVTETDLLAYSVPASTLGTDKVIRVSIKASYLNNSGSDRTFTLKIKYGATTMYSSATPALTTSATRRVVRIDFLLFAKNLVTSQGMSGSVKIGDDTAATVGLGDLAGGAASSQEISGIDAAENSAVGKTLSCTITHSFSASTVSFKRNYALIEVLD